MAGTDVSAAARVEALAYYEAAYDYYEQLEDLFGHNTVDDITDIDNEDSYEYSYLISLNRDKIKLLSEEIDDLLKEEDAYFFNILISREKPIASKCFWKYPKEGRGQELIVSPAYFLEDQAAADELFEDFLKKNALLCLTEEELQEAVLLHGQEVSIYYKYFNRSL
ncbi:MAG: hypothetical protein GX819_04510 [Clostridiaceae bacterium]|nr:hypothetical protein [Clostridiaceae bacterium]